MAETKKEKEAAARKRSDAAKKAAATRKANAEAEEKQNASFDPETPETNSDDQQTPEQEQAREGRKFGKTDMQTGRASWGVSLESHRADVNPGDQQAQAEQRQAELDEERRIHSLRTGGFKY